MKLVFAVLLFLISPHLIAQSIQLRGKVIDINKQPVKNLPIRFTSFGDAVTTSSGEFIISVPKAVNSVDVVVSDENYVLLFPVDSKLPVPVDINFISTIIVSSKSAPIGTSVDESISKYADLENLLKDVGTTNTELKAFLEKFIEIESKRLEISQAKLREEFERKNRRDAIFEEVSPLLKEYVLRLKNLKTNFEVSFESAFVSNPSVEHLNNAIRVYNPVFDTINNNQYIWKNDMTTAWDAVLAETFSSAINYMIDEVHIPNILQLNESIKTINAIRLKIVDDEQEAVELKKEVKSNVTAMMKNLEIKIPILENKFNEILTRMQHSEIN